MFSKTTRLSIALLAAAGFTPLIQLNARTEFSIYQEVKDEYLKTFAQEKKEPVYNDNQNQKTKKPEFVVEGLGTYTLHDLVANMFVQHGTLQKDNGVIDSTFIRKMELLCGGQDTQKNLLNQLISTDDMSVFGHIGFASILANPTANTSELRKRQTAIATFNAIFQHEKTNYALTAALENIKNAQAETIRYWQPDSEMNKNLFKQIYYSDSLGKNFNKSTIALESLTRLRNIGTVSIFFVPIEYLLIANYYYIRYAKAISNEKLTTTQIIRESLKLLKTEISFLINHGSFYKKNFKNRNFIEIKKEIQQQAEENRNWAPCLPQSLGDAFHVLNSVLDEQGISTAQKVGIAAYAGGLFGYIAYIAKKVIDMARIRTAVTNHIHERLIAVATCVREAKNIYTILRNHEAIAALPAFKQLASFFDNKTKHSNNLSRLLGMLQTNTFKGKPSFFTITGRVLAAHTLMQETKDELIPLFEAIGHLEAYIAAAKFYAKHKELPATCCFAEFISADKPVVGMKNFWNPFIDPNIVVTNNVIINDSGAERNVILTGPNTAGKSTVVKGAELNILLAQTFGFCTAQQVVLTPFSILNCHLNITDDIATGTSLFHAEVKRAKTLLNDIQSLKPNQFCFTIMDEVFNGTNAEGGSDAAYKFADQLGNYKNLILVVATHFGNLTELDKTGNFRNLHVGAHLNNGKLVRPFKLQDGIFKDPKNEILQAILEQEGIFTPQAAA